MAGQNTTFRHREEEPAEGEALETGACQEVTKLEITVASLSGRELAAVAAAPSWRLRDILRAVPEQPGESVLTQRTLLLAGEELQGEGTLAELGAVSGARLTLVVSPRRLALTSHKDGVVNLWCVATGACLCSYEADEAMVWSAVFSADNQEVLTASTDPMLWATATGTCTHTFKGHTKGVASAVFSSDGKAVVTGGFDGTAKLWKKETGECWRTLQHGRSVQSAAFSPSDTEVATASEDGTARLWHAATGQCLRIFEGHEGFLTSVAFSQDAAQLLTAADDGTAKLWALGTGECIRTFRGHGRAVCSAVFAPDSQCIATAAFDDTAKLWSLTSGECLRTLEGHRGNLFTAVFSSDGTKLLTSSTDGSAKLWCALTGACLRTFEENLPCPQETGVLSAALSH